MTTITEPAPDAPTDEVRPPEEPWWQRLLRGLVVPTLAIVSAMVVGALVIAFTDPDTLEKWGNFFSDPGAALSSSWDIAFEAYRGLFRSSLGSRRALSETLVFTTPLIFTGLSVALAFRAGLFNIGGEGQIIMGAVFATYVGFTFTDLPGPLHVLLAVVAGFLGGAIWGGLAGLFKATRGAHEVITTIMLNWIAVRFLGYLLRGRTFQREGRGDPISKIVDEDARLPRFDDTLRVNLGILLAIGAAIFVWWLLYRTTIGFRLRAVGANPDAARYAGVAVSTTFVIAMGLAGGLAGLAGASNTLGVQYSLTGGFTGYGFDGIAVALLARSNPLAVIGAAFLFGVLRAGSIGMQASTRVPVDIIVVIQALVILFVAAPALVREIYRLRVRDRSDESFAAGWGK